MDKLKSAIEQRYNETKYKELNQNSDFFSKNTTGKHVFLWGCGNGYVYLQRKFQNSFQITGIIDSDEKKQGIKWEEEYGTFSHTEDYFKTIVAPTILDQYDKDEVLILIMSFRYHDEIYKKLTDEGFYHVYSLINLLSNESAESIDALTDFSSLYQEKIKNNRVLINIGIHGNHGRVITEQLLKKYPDVEIVWVVRKKLEGLSPRIHQVFETNVIEYIKAVASSHVLIYDTVIFPFATEKKMNQVVIQLKHWSSITLKKFGFEEPGGKGTEAKSKARDMTDYIFTGSKFDENSCKTGLGDIPCVRIGSPRSDVLFSNDIRKNIYDKYGLDSETKTIIYAPTFRVNEKGRAIPQAVELDYQRTIAAFEKRFGGKWVLLLRLHPLIADCASGMCENVINVSHYPDGEEIVAAADVMISDYSSIMFEPMFVKRPVFLFAPDKENYVNKEMPLLLDYEKLPFTNVSSNEELEKVILEFDEDEYLNRINSFMDYHDVHEDGHASERAADFIWKCLQET